MEVSHAVLGIPGRFEASRDADMLQKLNVTAHFYLGTSINSIRYYAVKSAVLPEHYVNRCTPLFWKLVKDDESFLYVELGEAATAKIHKYLRKEWV